ncbi:MAG TPA: ATP-binding cassette domain-containing protein, partial [Anaerolinea sp.]|nr:ATP-binding cassette domain-containing protein [Anaerolinea sp.]
MPLLSATGLSKSYGPADIFKDLTFSIPNRARIGLVGANGVGKTTLLRVLMGQEESSEGGVQVARGVRIGYLPQRPNLDTSRSIWQECLSAFADLIEQQAEVARLEHAMAAEPGNQALLDAYGRVQMDFERRGGYTYETRMRQTLAGLGFQKEDYARPLNQSSGGQQTRAFLARLLLSDPDLLLLDEPTNHLDIEAIEWLEGHLREWEGAVLLVSHDRYFLDQVVEDIWEMTPALEQYNGNYSAYLQQREERYRRRMEEYEAQQAFVDKESEYIRRNIAGQNTNQAKGRLRRLERLLETAVVAPPVQARSLKFRFTPAMRSGDLVLRT